MIFGQLGQRRHPGRRLRRRARPHAVHAQPDRAPTPRPTRARRRPDRDAIGAWRTPVGCIGTAGVNEICDPVGALVVHPVVRGDDHRRRRRLHRGQRRQRHDLRRPRPGRHRRRQLRPFGLGDELVTIDGKTGTWRVTGISADGSRPHPRRPDADRVDRHADGPHPGDGRVRHRHVHGRAGHRRHHAHGDRSAGQRDAAALRLGARAASTSAPARRIARPAPTSSSAATAPRSPATTSATRHGRAPTARSSSTPTGHARDSDAIAGDNADIFRIVGTNGSQSTPNSYMTLPATTPTPAACGSSRAPSSCSTTRRAARPTTRPRRRIDRGAADEIHGESRRRHHLRPGRQRRHLRRRPGRRHHRRLGQRLDLRRHRRRRRPRRRRPHLRPAATARRLHVERRDRRGSACTGNAAGTASPSRCTASPRCSRPIPTRTTRNGNVLNEFIYTPGQVQTATINVAGALNKAVDLTPFNLDPRHDQTARSTPNGYDDIIFGGLGNDFLHGGSGDDAIVGRRGARRRRTSSSTRTTRPAASRTTTA